MYQDLRDLVERVILQKAKIDRQTPTDRDSFGTCSTSTWSMEALPSKSMESWVPMKNRLGTSVMPANSQQPLRGMMLCSSRVRVKPHCDWVRTARLRACESLLEGG
jgi:hypothetical protein